ncbi:MAG: hypothetical protein ACYSW3_02625, partial [Planctomycetota bacterium]
MPAIIGFRHGSFSCNIQILFCSTLVVDGRRPVGAAIRRTLAIILRCILIIILIALLARLTRTKKNEQLTTIVVLDRSQSIPAQLQQDSL